MATIGAKVNRVQLDSLVVMKIVKHIENERLSGAGMFAHGWLTGLVAVGDQRLEITNCFPTVRSHTVADDDKAQQDIEDESQKEMQQEMLKRFRQMNIDYELVGFYESHAHGACFNKQLVEDMFEYQSTLEDAVVLIYDPVSTCQGSLALKAYRLSKTAMELCYTDLSPEAVKKAGLTYSNMFEELPVIIKNSHLINVLLAELAYSRPNTFSPPSLEIGADRSLARCMRQSMFDVEALNRTINEYNKYTQNKGRSQGVLDSLVQKRQLENENRRERGEPPLPVNIQELKSSIKWPVLQGDGMLNAFLAAREVSANVEHALQVSKETLGKLHVAETIALDKGTASRQ
jgi:translation initiation factor 3 subunit H